MRALSEICITVSSETAELFKMEIDQKCSYIIYGQPQVNIHLLCGDRISITTATTGRSLPVTYITL